MEQNGSNSGPTILHCFADHGSESEILGQYGRVIRIGVDPTDRNSSEPIRATAHILDDGVDVDVPLKDDSKFDFGLFHPVCSKWASTTSISGDPDQHVDMIPSARSIANRFCEFYAIENVPGAPLRDPTILDGRMFGLPIEFKRAFETNFRVPQPPKYKRYWSHEGSERNAETSSFFFTEKSRMWWGSVKGVNPCLYTKTHLAKNTIPAAFVHHISRMHRPWPGITHTRIQSGVRSIS